jgi:Helix-turn-helix domain
MSGRSRYSGDPAKAARLHAARVAAGFATAREAAQKFGWSEPRYRSNESAARAISPVAAREYAQAFGTSPEWLLEGRNPEWMLQGRG